MAPTSEISREHNAADSRRSRSLYLFVPLAFVAALVLVFGWGLTRDPVALPSALIGQSVPAFSLPPVAGREFGLSSQDLVGEMSLVNVFASWCAPCREEHPLLMRLKEEGQVTVYGINYKDNPSAADQWLNALGDPFTRTGADVDGRVAIEWGVYGVPETFVVDAEGTIIYKHIGVLTDQTIQNDILPLFSQVTQ
ncbi:DsbE family thiol:disulfide interchange protein [Pelagibacterium sp.]|jgi:cytochrome c biogenesis protein CcmG, thiol:disulfide interchange protein DsbE|uniref:DsbE family thiol:disulfide interchange protein n=1 Tax=Pelagibacterium sp. TaxID=1967288 RepID=UPI003BABC910